MSERETEYYLKNRDKIDLNDPSTWKYYPVGEPRRKTYDYNNLLLDDYLERYYKTFENDEHWQRQWMDAVVLTAYNRNAVKLADRMGEGVLDWFSFERMHDFYNGIKDNALFEDDVLLFFSWMEGMSFFKKQAISFSEWINSRAYNVGGRREIKKDIYSLSEIAKHKFGMNLVRDKLMNLEWHKH